MSAPPRRSGPPLPRAPRASRAARAPPPPAPRPRVPFAGLVLHGARLGWVLSRALTFTLLAVGLFLLAFLGYFTLPFVILGAGLLLLALGSWLPPLERVGRRARALLGRDRRR